MTQLVRDGAHLIERAVEEHLENERRILSALTTTMLADLDTALSALLQALEGSPGGD